MAKAKPIKVTIEFSVNDCNRLLDMCNFGDNEPKTLETMSVKEQKAFAKALNDTPFIEEIMDGSYDACANDWLYEFRNNEEG